MASFSYNFTKEKIDKKLVAHFVELTGSIDPESFESFAEMFDELLDQGAQYLAIDFEGLKYINSTGMGLMIQIIDKFNDVGGKIVLMRISPKVMVVMEMLGLQEFFQIVNDENQAIAAFSGKEVDGTTVQAKLKENDIEEIEEEEDDSDIDGKTAVRCDNCNAKLNIAGEGSYKCPRCRAVFKVSASGKVKAYPESDKDVVELVVPACATYLDGLEKMLANCAKQTSIKKESANAVFGAVKDTFNYVLENALPKTTSERVQIFINTKRKKLSVYLFVAGKTLELDEELDGIEEFSDAVDNVDRFEYSIMNGGNLFRIEKK